MYESEPYRRGDEYGDPDLEEMGREMWESGKRGVIKQANSEVRSAARSEALEIGALDAGIEVEKLSEALPADDRLAQHLPAVPEITRPSTITSYGAPRRPISSRISVSID